LFNNPAKARLNHGAAIADFAGKINISGELCTKIAEKLENAQNPHFSSGVKMGVPAPELKCGLQQKSNFCAKPFR
jgi:hypothetical protein